MYLGHLVYMHNNNSTNGLCFSTYELTTAINNSPDINDYVATYIQVPRPHPSTRDTALGRYTTHDVTLARVIRKNPKFG